MEKVRLLILSLAMLGYLTALGFNVVSVTTSEWYVDRTNTSSTAYVRRGLWIQCTIDGLCKDVPNNDVHRTVRAFTMMALLVGTGTLVLLLMGINEEASKYKLLSAMLLFVTAIFQLIGMSVYTDEQRDLTDFSTDHWGYSFDFGWASVFLYGFAGICFLVVATILQGQKRVVRYAHVRA